jgi:hypothetical protein
LVDAKTLSERVAIIGAHEAGGADGGAGAGASGNGA